MGLDVELLDKIRVNYFLEIREKLGIFRLIKVEGFFVIRFVL